MKNYKILKCNDKGELDVLYTRASGSKDDLRKYFKNFKDGFVYLVFEEEEKNTIVDTIQSIFDAKYSYKDLKDVFFLMRYLEIDFLEIKIIDRELEQHVFKFSCTLEFQFLGIAVSGMSNMSVYEDGCRVLELETL